MSRILLLSLILSSIAHGQIAMQDWRIHFSVNNTVGIAENTSRIYSACANGVIEYDTDDNSVNMLTVTNGLSDLGISAIDSDGSDVVILGYSNGNLDIIEGNTITNIPWIKKAEISGNKKVNSFYFDGDIIYVATNIGLVVLDNAKKEIKDTYYPFDDPQIFDVTIFKDSIYCATENGIYHAHKDQSFLNDKNNWSKPSFMPSNLNNLMFGEIETFGDNLVFSYDGADYNTDSLYYYNSNGFNVFTGNPVEILDIKAQGDKLLVCFFSNLLELDNSFNITTNIFEVQGTAPIVKGAIYRDGFYWIADENNGMVKALNSWSSDVVFNNTPYTDGSYRIDIQYGNVLIAGGGLTHNLQNNYFRNGVYKFEDEEWINFNHKTQDSIKIDQDWDFISVAVNPLNTDEFAFASYSAGGLMVVKDGKTISEVYNTQNSPIEAFGGQIKISDIKYDLDGNLWIVNQGIEPLKVLTPEGIWYSFEMGSPAKNSHPYRLLIDNDGNKWVGFNHVGVVAFNDNGTLADESDDQLQTLTTTEGYGNLPSAFPKAIAEDIDGEIWIGTDLGMVILYNTSNLYDGDYGDYDANPILIEVDGEVEKLLGETDITTITIDGGNRKWIGTSSSGIFCLSEDGTEEIYRFTKENSPLISNNIFDIRINHLTGEVFVATESGLVSFRTDATIADNDYSDVTVFPNPVRPDFGGPITIQGLGYESDVKITDVAGNVVYKSRSNGGTVIWDGNTVNGERVKTGVYLVWTARENGKGKNVAKVVVIN
ncbi:hypothetical protein K6119_10400 [Paracrocinitomix mangrovi]|uniref:type IX secretion system anionic LPS delivery protein PorZ n=1 Tax=Paracrocinitomix mangrovi TaxID=2862509 RepID=UPI001C8D1731|nr:two-component regulator propeller domain-containing protein [Paracrocinitomix mangrovi]UKN00144.1 hypothetical protein K6119_10400 [Paracrocinitomix mangrovi]